MQAKQASNVKAIDVSHHQGIIDWEKVKADGVLAGFIKASEGLTFVDDHFKANVSGALAAGLKVGFYHYVHPESNDANAEAAHFADVVKGLRADFPHVIDVEGDAAKLDTDKLSAWCVKWLQEVERLTGHPTMIYTGASFARSELSKVLAKWELWVAHYYVEQPMADPIWDEWSVFQYTDKGKVQGISGNVDVNAMERAFYDKYATPNKPQPTGEDNIPVLVNGEIAAYGRVINGHVYLPIRQLGEALGKQVHWDPAAATVYVDGRPVKAFQLIAGKTYIGVREAAELLGGSAVWDGKVKKVIIE